MLTECAETSKGLLQDFDLSHLRSLQSLEVTVSSIPHTRQDTLDLFRDVASTITSPVFSEVVIIFQRPDLYRPTYIPFDVFREMYSKREFRLVFCLEVPKSHRNFGLDVMRRNLDWGESHQKLDFLASPATLAISERNSWMG